MAECPGDAQWGGGLLNPIWMRAQLCSPSASERDPLT
jgi:hypothetical protein